MDPSTTASKKPNLDKDLLDILCCPETKQPISLMTDQEVSLLNHKIDQGQLTTHSGCQVKEKLQGGLITTDRKRVYPIREDIPILLIEEGIAVAGLL